MVNAGYLALALGAAVAAGAAPAPLRLYVWPQGDDQWTGRLPRPNAAATDGPLATLPRARDVVRELRRGGLQQPIEVLLSEGTHYLSQPLVLTPEDSGTAECPITWRAAEGAQPTISGGVPITGWRRQADGLWAADLPAAREGKLRFRTLRVGDQWATRARHPNADPQDARTKGWLFAQYGGEPWERGAFGVGVANVHNVGDELTWKVRVPAAGTYTVWVRYGHKMTDYGRPEMGGVSALQVDGGADALLQNLPDTGGWDKFRWSRSASLTLTAGEHVLRWHNLKGGGLNLDAFVLCDDPAWEPEQSITDFTWWGSFTVKPPAAGKHYLLIQTEACDTHQGPEIRVPQATPPGTVTHLTYRPGELPAIADASGAEVHIFIAWGWVNAIVPIGSIDATNHRVNFAGAGAAQDVRMGNRYFIENVREALDAPGEWFLDTKAGQLLYLPASPDFPKQPVVAGVLDRLIDLQGEAAKDRWVEHVRFEGLRFRDTGYHLTADYYTPSDGTIRAAGARHCRVSRCDFGWLGGYGVHLEQRTHEFEVRRCAMHDLGQGGVHLVGGTKDQPHHCRVLGNTIERIGLIYKHVAGVYLTHGSDNLIAHNRITDTPRYAISFKSQGEDRLSHRNVAEYNELLRTNLETNDTGAFESLGYEHRDSGNVVRYNLILDSVGLATTPDGQILTPHFTWGVYLDDYSSGTTVYGNIIARTVNGGVCVHGGANNQIENNIIVDGHDHQLRLQPRDDYMKGNTFRHNIVSYARPEAQLIFSWRNQAGMFTICDENLYWLRGGDLRQLTAGITPAGPWAKWLAAGHDRKSQVADPLFVDAAKDDYRLKPESPAWALGFERIPVERIGPAGLQD